MQSKLPMAILKQTKTKTVTTTEHVKITTISYPGQTTPQSIISEVETAHPQLDTLESQSTPTAPLKLGPINPSAAKRMKELGHTLPEYDVSEVGKHNTPSNQGYYYKDPRGPGYYAPLPPQSIIVNTGVKPRYTKSGQHIDRKTSKEQELTTSE